MAASKSAGRLPAPEQFGAEFHATDQRFLILKESFRGYQLLSVLTPPFYAAFVLRKRGLAALTTNNFLRATWIGGAGGAISAATAEGVYVSWQSPQHIAQSRIRVMYDPSKLRAEDYSTIGGLLGVVLTPSVLWRRARIIHLILGGGGLGAAAGAIVHYAQLLAT